MNQNFEILDFNLFLKEGVDRLSISYALLFMSMLPERVIYPELVPCDDVLDMVWHEESGKATFVSINKEGIGSYTICKNDSSSTGIFSFREGSPAFNLIFDYLFS